MNEKKEDKIRGISERIQDEPIVLKRATSTQKFKNGGRPKFKPMQRLSTKRRVLVEELVKPKIKLREPVKR